MLVLSPPELLVVLQQHRPNLALFPLSKNAAREVSLRERTCSRRSVLGGITAPLEIPPQAWTEMVIKQYVTAQIRLLSARSLDSTDKCGPVVRNDNLGVTNN